ncbi:uncharacterized protein G2W53_022303 [Senna tora]|uniref:Uncharacterized protein n=1 Tax=Senna tora TaxID=362788 RepID=A0A834TU62_9FABA|nr:uncharacterized protein G2W53_022303 [Senna tora]
MGDCRSPERSLGFCKAVGGRLGREHSRRRA